MFLLLISINRYVTDVNTTSYKWLYPKFWEVMETYKLMYKWNVTEILSRKRAPPRPDKIDTWFVVKDLALNSVYASGWNILGDLARELGDIETANKCDREAFISTNAILKKMWSSDQGIFQTVYTDADGRDKFSVANTVQNLFPLLLRDLPADKVALLVDQLKDSSKFNAPYSVPTVAQDDPQFCPTFDAGILIL